MTGRARARARGRARARAMVRARARAMVRARARDGKIINMALLIPTGAIYTMGGPSFTRGALIYR